MMEGMRALRRHTTQWWLPIERLPSVDFYSLATSEDLNAKSERWSLLQASPG